MALLQSALHVACLLSAALQAADGLVTFNSSGQTEFYVNDTLNIFCTADGDVTIGYNTWFVKKIGLHYAATFDVNQEEWPYVELFSATYSGGVVNRTVGADLGTVDFYANYSRLTFSIEGLQRKDGGFYYCEFWNMNAPTYQVSQLFNISVYDRSPRVTLDVTSNSSVFIEGLFFNASTLNEVSWTCTVDATAAFIPEVKLLVAGVNVEQYAHQTVSTNLTREADTKLQVYITYVTLTYALNVSTIDDYTNFTCSGYIPGTQFPNESISKTIIIRKSSGAYFPDIQSTLLSSTAYPDSTPSSELTPTVMITSSAGIGSTADSSTTTAATMPSISSDSSSSGASTAGTESSSMFSSTMPPTTSTTPFMTSATPPTTFAVPSATSDTLSPTTAAPSTTSATLSPTTAAPSTTSATLSPTTAAPSAASAAPSATSATLFPTTAAPFTTSAAQLATSATLFPTTAAPSTVSAAPSTTSATLSPTTAAPSTTSAAQSTTSATLSPTTAAPSTTSAAPSTTSATPSVTSALPSATTAALSTTTTIPSTTSAAALSSANSTTTSLHTTLPPSTSEASSTTGSPPSVDTTSSSESPTTSRYTPTTTNLKNKVERNFPIAGLVLTAFVLATILKGMPCGS